MTNHLRLTSDTKLEIQYLHDAELSSLKPFVNHISMALRASKPLIDSVLAAASLYPEAADRFEIDPPSIESTFRLKDQYTFREWSPHRLRLSNRAKAVLLDLENPEVLTTRLLGDFLEALSCSDSSSLRRLANNNDRIADLLDYFNDNAFLENVLTPPLVIGEESHPSITRLQHASLLYRCNGAGILVDPHLHSSYNTNVMDDISRFDLEGKVDAILISHSHLDHWWLSTLLMFPKNITILVPKVPRSTMLCGNMETQLRDLGFVDVRACDWYSEPVRIKDFEVYTLPFYGEQPLLYEETRDRNLRNWGNTYVVRCPQFTSWFLIDSGQDALGKMVEVAEYVHRFFGELDFLFSNLREFTLYTPFYINGGGNWLALKPSQMIDFHTMTNHCITLGAKNVGQICKIVGARYFLPYAHWWGEIGGRGQNDPDVPGPNEKRLLHDLELTIRELGAATEIMCWNIGDAVIPHTGRKVRLRPLH